MDVHWHEVSSDHSNAGTERDGQGRLFRNAAISVSDTASEKRDSLPARIAKLKELCAIDPAAHRVIWHHLEDERHAIADALPGVVSVYGSQDLDEREQLVVDFSDGKIQQLASKPVLLGSGCNLQRFCHWSIFLGIGHKFSEFIQACHRVQRFGQKHPVRLDLIYTEAERDIRRNLERKWSQHNEMVKHMTTLIQEYGLSQASMISALTRSLGVDRVEVKGDGFTMVNHDAVIEMTKVPENSVHLLLTSIPFSTQYEYSPNYADFGHSDHNEHSF